MCFARRLAFRQDHIPHWIFRIDHTLSLGISEDSRNECFDVSKSRGCELVFSGYGQKQPFPISRPEITQNDLATWFQIALPHISIPIEGANFVYFYERQITVFGESE